MSRVMLTTTQTQTCVSATFTDPKMKPSWKGKRFAFLQKKPDKEEMWSVEYIAIRQQAMTEGDEFARKAHQFYLEHREEMDAGAVVANPFSYDGRILPDGSQLQVSAIQRYYDFVADNGEDAALCELQNKPPDEAKVQESGITPSRIQCQVSGYPRANHSARLHRAHPGGRRQQDLLPLGRASLAAGAHRLRDRVHDRLWDHRGAMGRRREVTRGSTRPSCVPSTFAGKRWPSIPTSLRTAKFSNRSLT